MKKLIYIILFLLISISVISQNYIKIVNRDIFRVTKIVVDTSIITYKEYSDFSGIEFKNNSDSTGTFKIKKQDVEYVESETGQLYYYKEQSKNCNNVDVPKQNLNKLIKKGNNVYVPFPNEQNDVTNRLGNAILRDYIRNSNYWHLVDCKTEADFILEYRFSEVGRDNAELVIIDRYGKKVFSSGFVRASDEDNRAAAKKSIKELYNKCIHKQ